MGRQRFILAAIVAVLFSVSVHAQIGIKFRGSGDWSIGDPYEQYFINTKLESVTGKVTSIDTVTPLRGMAAGIGIVLKTDREDIAVHLGPSWFILFQDMSLSVNDANVEVRGCRTTINGKPVIMASTLVRGRYVLHLRDSDGVPYWCAWRKRFN